MNLLKLLSRILPILFLLILTLFFFYPLLTGHFFTAKGFIQADLLTINFPLRWFYGESLRPGIFPFWLSQNGLGYPVFAEGEVGMLYPIHFLLHRFLPPLAAFNLNTIVHV